MAITNAEAIRFSDEQVRPTAEKMRNLYYELEAMNVDWFNGISAVTPNDALETLDDGRTAEGISTLTGADINALMTQVGNYIALVEAVGVLNVIQKPCVQVFRE